MKYERSLIKSLKDLTPHPDYLPGDIATKGNKVKDIGDGSPNAAGRGVPLAEIEAERKGTEKD